MKKTIRFWAGAVAVILGSIALQGCAAGETGEANVMEFDMTDISDLTISYDEEELIFYEQKGGSLTVKEFMSDNNRKYYAKVQQNSDSIHISEGRKPFFSGGFTRRVEIYLPDTYTEYLKVSTTNGVIDMTDIGLELDSVYLTTTSGQIEADSIRGEQVRLETTSGDITCRQLSGNVVYTSTSGNAEFQSVKGAGTFKAENSGILDVTFAEVDGDLYMFNKNDDVQLTLPEGISFDFEAVTKNGSVSVPFQEVLSKNGRTLDGTVGVNPEIKIKLETKNGNIQVVQ